MSRLPNPNMVAVRGSRFSNASQRRRLENCISDSAFYRPTSWDRPHEGSPEASRTSSRPTSQYRAYRDNNVRFQNNSSRIHFNEQNLRNNRNKGFQHGDPSVLDRFNYATNIFHLRSTGYKNSINPQSPISGLGQSGNNNVINNFPAVVSQSAEDYQAYQNAEATGRQGAGQL